MARKAIHFSRFFSASQQTCWWSAAPYLSQEKGWLSLLELVSLCFLHFKCLLFPPNKKQAGKQARHPDASWVSLGFLFFSSSGKHNWKQHLLQVSVKQAYLLGLAQAWSTMLVTFVFPFHCHYCSILCLLHIFIYKILDFSTQTLPEEKQADKTAKYKLWK